jgi:carbon storage regulator CsrA
MDEQCGIATALVPPPERSSRSHITTPLERRPAMLVLSRKENQRVLFPHLGITVEVLHLSGNSVQLGVDAPQSVRVLREEVALREGIDMKQEVEAQRRARHALRNRLNAATLALHVLQKQLDAGEVHSAQSTLEQTLEEFNTLDAIAAADAQDPHQQRHRRALLVEDNVNERELLAGLLRMSGYEVEVAEDGVAAMRSLSRSQPDIVLLDMQMPGMDGRETLSAIRHHPAYCNLKVFAVTGADRTVFEPKSEEHGFDRWFSKPLNPRRFVAELEEEMASTSA